MNTRKPIAVYPHLKCNAKRNLMELQRKQEIERENRLMHERLSRRKKGDSEYRDRGRDASSQAQLAVRASQRRMAHEQIQRENDLMVARIMQQSSEFTSLDEDWKDKQVLLKRIARHPIVLGAEDRDPDHIYESRAGRLEPWVTDMHLPRQAFQGR